MTLRAVSVSITLKPTKCPCRFLHLKSFCLVANIYNQCFEFHYVMLSCQVNCVTSLRKTSNSHKMWKRWEFCFMSSLPATQRCRNSHGSVQHLHVWFGTTCQNVNNIHVHVKEQSELTAISSLCLSLMFSSSWPWTLISRSISFMMVRCSFSMRCSTFWPLSGI